MDKPKAQATTLLQVYAAPNVTAGSVRVFWRNYIRGQRPKKVHALDVSLPPDCDDPCVVGECVALNYLLLTKEILGPNRSGINLHLVVSKGAIRKLMLQKTMKPHVRRYAGFLQTRFADAGIHVEKNCDVWTTYLREPAELVSYLVCQEGTIETTQGAMCLTTHAVQRFAERVGMRDMSRAWQRLSSILSGCELTKTRPTASYLKDARYKESTLYRFMYGSNSIVAVVVTEDGWQKVVTLYFE